jgi:hypothetical protein
VGGLASVGSNKKEKTFMSQTPSQKSSFKRFNTNMNRAISLVNKGTEEARFAVVLGVAAMDDYFTQRFCDDLVVFLKNGKKTQALETPFDKASFTRGDVLTLLVDYMAGDISRPFKRIRAKVENYLSDYTTQQFTAIDSLFLSYSYKNFTNNVLKKMNKKDLMAGKRLRKSEDKKIGENSHRKRINELIERRHQIVHDGDVNSDNKLRTIDAKFVEKRLYAIKFFVDAAEDILNQAY